MLEKDVPGDVVVSLVLVGWCGRLTGRWRCTILVGGIGVVGSAAAKAAGPAAAAGVEWPCSPPLRRWTEGA
jgi:hypothetical protein